MEGTKENSNKKEYGARKPDDYDGDHREIQRFLLNCKVYLQINKHIYDTDESQIAFVLSFMNKKEAGKWKENYLLSLVDGNGDIAFPTMKEFMDRLTKDFKPANKERSANHQIAVLRQGKKTTEETIKEFRFLTNQAGYTVTTPSDHMHLIGKLQSVLNTNLVRRISLLDEEPTTIDKYAKKAIQIDSNYRHTQELLEILNEEKRGLKPSSSKSTNNSKANNNNNWRKKKDEKDPNAMDVDTMTAGKCAYLMKKGACFVCEEPGHRASEHDKHVKKQQKSKGKDKTTPKKDLKALHALFQSLTKGEKEELLAMTTQNGKGKEDEEEEDDDKEDF